MDPIRIIENYYDSKSTAYSILVTHSRSVAQLALAVAKELAPEKIDLDFVREAAMLHDIGICRTYAPMLDCWGQEPYLRHGVLGRKILENEGLYKHALVCERHVGTGISMDDVLANNLPLPRHDMLPISREEKIIAFADKFFSKTGSSQIKKVDTVKKELAAISQDKKQVFCDWLGEFSLQSPAPWE